MRGGAPFTAVIPASSLCDTTAQASLGPVVCVRVDLFLIRPVQYFGNESAAAPLGMASSSRMCVAGRLFSEAILALLLRDMTARTSLGAVVCVRADLFLICSVQDFRNRVQRCRLAWPVVVACAWRGTFL